MRVTHVITRLIVGGAQENTIASVLGLQQTRGVEVHIISGPTSGPEGSLEHRVSGRTGIFELVPDLVRPIHPWHDVQAWRQLVTLFRKQQPDIVHTHSGKAGILGRLAARQARIPVVIHTIHGPSFGPFQGALANSFFRLAERTAATCTTHFVVVADAMAKQYLAAGIGNPAQFTKIYSGFDLQPFLNAKNDPAFRAQLGLRPDDFVVGKIARLFRLKGHDDLFQAASDMIKQWPSLKFLLVGDGAWRDRFEAWARQMGLSGHFIFAGLIPPAEVPRWIGIMDAVIHLSRREGLPRALPQALAAGKPVVAYDCDGASEVCLEGQTGFLIRAGDQSTLSQRVLQLAKDPALRERLGQSGRALVQDRFPVERMVSDLHSLYQRLLTAKP